MLASVFSILLEALYFTAFKVFGTTKYGNMTNFWSQSYYYFHFPAAFVTDLCVTMHNGSMWHDIVGFVIFFSIAIFEWWIALFAGFSFVQHFTAKGRMDKDEDAK